MASKSSTVVLPLVLGLCAWWVKGRWQWRNLVRLAPIALMAVVPVALTIWTQKLRGQGAESLQWTRTFPERLVTSGDAIWFYLGKLLWPHPLDSHLSTMGNRCGLVAFVSALCLAWASSCFSCGKNVGDKGLAPTFLRSPISCALLLPVVGLIDGFYGRYSLVADHFQYLLCMALLALVGAGLTRWADRVLPENPQRQTRLCAGLLLILGMVSWQRAWVYQNLQTL